MSVEICFRLSIWPLQQLSALPEFHFLVDMDPLASPAAECPSGVSFSDENSS